MNKIITWLIALLLVCSVCYANDWIDKLNANNWHTVHATREGLVGHTTANGHRITEESLFVALPHRKALNRVVVVKYDDRIIICKVKDVGPWSTGDDYWNKKRGPLAEEGKRIPEKWGKARNPAGIDLSNGVWDFLEIERGKGIVEVEWKFLDKGE